MICTTCHQEIPTLKRRKRYAIPLLGCPKCLELKSYQEALKSQKHFLPRITKDELYVKLTKPASEFKWHMVLVGYPQTWCGAKPNTRWKDNKLLHYSEIIDGTVCGHCRDVFKQLAAEQTRPPAQTMEEIR